MPLPLEGPSLVPQRGHGGQQKELPTIPSAKFTFASVLSAFSSPPIKNAQRALPVY